MDSKVIEESGLENITNYYVKSLQRHLIKISISRKLVIDKGFPNLYKGLESCNFEEVCKDVFNIINKLVALILVKDSTNSHEKSFSTIKVITPSVTYGEIRMSIQELGRELTLKEPKEDIDDISPFLVENESLDDLVISQLKSLSQSDMIPVRNAISHIQNRTEVSPIDFPKDPSYLFGQVIFLKLTLI